MAAPSEETSSVETLLEETGGCGPFQVLIIATVLSSLMTTAWSLMFMSFGNYNPGWHCVDMETNISSYLNITERVDKNETMANECDAFRKCNDVIYSNDTSTLVTEWNLACDESWVISMITSLKLAGVIVGNIIGGYLNDYFGRKPCFYGGLVMDALLNVASAFAVNWQMYAATQCFEGIVLGSISISFTILPLEFIVKKWRFITGTMPFWNIGGILLSCAAILLKNWRYIHLSCAGLSGILALSVFCVPESFRWLAVRGKSSRAIQVALKMSRYNRRQKVPMDVIHRVLQQIKNNDKRTISYGIVALYRYGSLKKIFVVNMYWISLSLISYTILFNVKSLSGDFYINLMLVMTLPILSTPFIPLLTNTIGRKRSCLLFLGLTIVGYISLLIIFFSSAHLATEAGITRIIILTMTVIADASWSTIFFYGPELFPTVLRSMSQSQCNCCGKIAAMLSPFIIFTNPRDTYITYLIVLSAVVITWLSLFLLPETRGKDLADLITCEESERKKLSDDKNDVHSL